MSDQDAQTDLQGGKDHGLTGLQVARLTALGQKIKLRELVKVLEKRNESRHFRPGKLYAYL